MSAIEAVRVTVVRNRLGFWRTDATVDGHTIATYGASASVSQALCDIAKAPAITELTQPSPEARTEESLAVTMPRRAWELVLQSEPVHQENYTDEGITLFNAWQEIRRAVADMENPA